MSRSRSPLRYPGGKSSLADFVFEVLDTNYLRRAHYVEPFAGGASLALHLLFHRHVSDIHINDIDGGIWSFWHSVLNDTENLVTKIEKIEITVAEWHRQKAVYSAGDVSDPLSLGFAAFFLNRTNRSGIIGSGGIIGGLKQEGAYKIDCRFNRRELIDRIRNIRRFRSSIHLTRMDAAEFLLESESRLSSRTLFMIDPPYFEKGSSLYTNFYVKKDHAELATVISKLSAPWVLTYDNCEEISGLYNNFQQIPFGIQYSVNEKREGKELLVASENLRISELATTLLDARSRRMMAA